MMTSVKRNFILQQGFQESLPAGCPLQYSALQFQPRIIFIWIIAGILSQSSLVFAALSAVLWWSALLPGLNPFDALYNRTIGQRTGAYRLSPAPAPRRIAQAIAGSFALACALLIYFQLAITARLIEIVLLAAVLAVTVGGFCLGSFVYHVFRGNRKFARETLPWAR